VRKDFCVQRIATLAVVLLLTLTVDGFAQNREKFVISAKAGGINAVTGQASVHARGQSEWQQLMVTDDLDAGDRVRTAFDGRVEILLNPGSYLRIGANSEVELANNSLENLEVRLIRGTAIVEATGGDGIVLNISISTPHAKLAIVRHGLYRLNVIPSDNTTELIVRKGRVLLGDSQTKVKAGNKVVFVGTNFSVAKLTDEEKKKKNRDEMDLWSKDRAETLAKANRRITDRMMTSAFASWTGFGRNGFRSGGFWFYNPRSFCYTFLPFGFGWGSPYGGGYTTTIYRNPYYYSRPTNGGWPSGSTTSGSTTYPRPTVGTTPSVAAPKNTSRIPIDDVGSRPVRKSMP
jgi:FecR protein